MKPGWKTTKNCPICGKDNCKISDDSAVCLCLRISEGAFQSVKGWHHHRLADKPNGLKLPEYIGAAHRKPKPAKPATSLEAVRIAAAASAGGTLAGEWTYHYSDDREALRVLRIALADGDKSYRPIYPAKGGWRLGDPAGKLPLYRLPCLEGEPTVWVFEGEKCCDIAVGIGLPATTSAHGAGSAEKTDWNVLAGREVFIVPDAGEAGAKYERDVSRILLNLEPPARVRIVRLPGLAEGEDIEQYLAAGGTCEAIEAMAAAAPFVERHAICGGPVLTCMADIAPREIAWLWPGRVPLGRITLIVGRPGEGKSFLTTDMAARITTGTPWPDGSECVKGSVILVSCEDSPGDTIRPRLDAHGADCRKVHLLTGVRYFDENAKAQERMFTLADLPALELALKQHPDCKLIIVDPIGSFLGGSTDAHRDNEVRAVLAPVARLAEHYGPAVVVVAHRRKAAGTSADDLALGSRAFTGLARAVWHLSRDKDDKNRRLFLSGKANLAKEGDGLAFKISGDPPALVWESGPVKMTADDAMEDESRRGPEPEARAEAERWLAELLADGPVASAQIKADSKAAGISYATIRRASDKLKIRREKCRFTGGWQWRLPRPAGEVAQVVGPSCSPAPNVNNLSNMSTFVESS